MLQRYSLSLITALILFLIPSASAETAGTVNRLAGLFGQDAGSPRQGASVPISVVHGATFAEFGASLALGPNTFGTIFGPVQSTSPAQGAGSGSMVNRTMDWGQSFVNGSAPTNLGGVEVRVNGKNAFISFTGLGNDFGRQFDQINFISPDETARGPVTVEVFKDGAMVGSRMVTLDTISPALFAYSTPDGQGNLYYAGLTAPDTAYVAPSNLFGVPTIGGFPVRPVRPGEVVQLFGTGFGETNPPTPAGRLAGAAELVTKGTMRIGGLPATIAYQGMAPGFAGVYQFNVTVPAGLQNGNHRIEIDIQGKTTPLNAFLPVQAQ
jgi:uncharacterized protein (TIGR03437 family)